MNDEGIVNLAKSIKFQREPSLQLGYLHYTT